MAAKFVRLRNDSISVHEATKTINLAFSDDPLIRWLRPGAQTWGELSPSSMEWGQRRVRRMNATDLVMCLVRRQTVSTELGKGFNLSAAPVSGGPDEDFGAIAMIQQPEILKRFELNRVLPKLKMWFLDKFKPVIDESSSEERIEIMMKAHNEGMAEMREKFKPRHPWYVEVVAIRPSLQGRGLGGHIMRAIISMAGDAPIVLECTSASNIDFYKRYGFEEVKMVTLKNTVSGPEDSFSYCLMVRP